MKQWLAFIAAGLIWGSSFLWIKIAVAETSPFTLNALRFSIASLGLLIILLWRKQLLPREPKILLAYLFMGLFNLALPLTLVSWGETKIDSSLASILNATVPLFTIIIAHLWIRDEKINLSRVTGLTIGFIGVIVLMSQSINLQKLGNIWAQLAIIGAAFSYSLAIVFSRRYLRNQTPIVQSSMMILNATAIMWIVTPFVESPIILPTQSITWIAIAWLGLLSSFIAYLLFFYLIRSWGPTRASLITYIFPVIGLILGIVFLDEKLDWNIAIGSLLIITGIVAVNFKQFTFKKTK